MRQFQLQIIFLYIKYRLKQDMHIDMELTTSAGTHDISSYSDCKQQQIVPASIQDKKIQKNCRNIKFHIR